MRIGYTKEREEKTTKNRTRNTSRNIGLYLLPIQESERLIVYALYMLLFYMLLFYMLLCDVALHAVVLHAVM